MIAHPSVQLGIPYMLSVTLTRLFGFKLKKLRIAIVSINSSDKSYS